MLARTPANDKSGGAAITMTVAVGSCSLGGILVAATDDGISAVLLGDDADVLLRDLQNRFPRAALVNGNKRFEKRAAQVIALVERPENKHDLPLDIQGTVFQHKVWRALQDIPSGTTASYADIARRIGAPKAVRAVAGACAANPVAVIIPCHRVVRSDGQLSGYRWGLVRKRTLLDREARLACSPVKSGRARSQSWG